MKFSVITLGCKVNQYESQAMISKLEELGTEVTEGFEKADCYIVNTCSVTMEADKKSRQTVAKLNKLNADARIYICGCSSQNNSKNYLNKPNVKIISGTASKIELIDSIMSDIVQHNKTISRTNIPSLSYEDNLKPKLTRTRGLIKIQDGCNNFCSYCIVPYLRGRSRSRPISSIIAEAERTALISKEIVLNGINISAYGIDFGSSLTELIYSLKHISVRKRLGSLECGVIDEKLLRAMKESGFCDHFHLSMQSGSDDILKAMNRHYSSKEYLDKVELIRKYFPDAGITTDIIAGFPLETDAQHSETLDTVLKAKFSDIHVFPFSPRKGTNAARLKSVDDKVKHCRTEELTQLKFKLKKDFLNKFIDKQAEVYFERVEDGYAVGYTSNYIKVYSPNKYVRELKEIKIKEIFLEGVKSYE